MAASFSFLPCPCCPPASVGRLRSDWERLCRDIGERRAGTPGEAQAAQYIAHRFSEERLNVRIESVPCRSLVGDESSVMVRIGRKWCSCEAHGFVGSPRTPGNEPVEGEIVWLEYPESAHRLGPNSLRHKIVVLFGPLPTSVRLYRQLVAARPAAILQVDDRVPFHWPIGDAYYPHWVKMYGAPPKVSIPYQSAWKWRIAGAARARVMVATRHRAAFSENVIATLPGADSAAASLFLAAHHDTQPFNTGADDNASGVICLLELARLLVQCSRRLRTIHFGSFGAEEQLSVGAAHFVRRHRWELNGIGLVVNFDGLSSPLGHNLLLHSGHPGLAGSFQAALRRGGHDAVIGNEISPFGDHFPFTVYGVPAICLCRSNMLGGYRWQHHSLRDSLANVSTEPVRILIDAIAPPILGLARARSLPFARKSFAGALAQTVDFARTLLGLRVPRIGRPRSGQRRT